VKICGLTNVEDAMHVAECGADFAGFIFAANSPRRVTPDQVRAIVARLPASLRKVGVFVDTPASRVCEIMDHCGLDIAQLHGGETVQQAREIGLERVWKAFHLVTDGDVETAAEFACSAVLADTMLPGRRGGTGVVGNWPLARKLAACRNLVLAGGIKPGNVNRAVAQVSPWAVDVGSGVEQVPGRKSPQRVSDLFAALNSANDNGVA
jgi:phosphoribosylanthranilate isomerase